MRLSDTENFRTMREMRERDPVQNAFGALACLSNEDLQKAVAEFNRVFSERHTNKKTLTIG